MFAIGPGFFLTETMAGTIWSRDPSMHGGDISISSNGLVATNNSGGYQTAYATKPQGAGKRQFEVSWNGAGTCFVGTATISAHITNGYVGSTNDPPNSIGYWSAGYLFYCLDAGVDQGTAVAAFGPGDVVTVGLNLIDLVVTIYKNGVLVISQAISTGYAWYPAASGQSGAAFTLNTQAQEFPITGFSAWDD